MVHQHQHQTWYQRLLKIEPGVSLSQWAADRIYNNWERLALLSVGGGTMTYAAIKDWVWNLGPLGWVSAFFIGVIATLLAVWLWEIVAVKRDRRIAYRDMASRPGAVNVLASEFRDKRMSVSDFFNIFLLPNRDKLFTNFELIGPANIVIQNCQMVGPIEFKDCQFILVRPDRPVNAVTLFQNCQFVRGKFVACALFIDANMLAALRQDPNMQGNINLITYEQVGQAA